MSLKRYLRQEYLKKKSLTISTNSTELEKLTRMICRTLRKAIKQRDIKIKPSLTKHWIELLKDTNTLMTNNPGTNFLFTYANVPVEFEKLFEK